MKKQKMGICKLCGQETLLTYEHVPPESAFNSFAVREYSPDVMTAMIRGDDGRMPWDLSGFYGRVNQRGAGDYYLCEKCNNDTGSWYISEYVKLANTFHDLIRKGDYKEGESYSFKLMGVYPLRLYKAIMTMYCDINHGCFGDEQLRSYLLDKESRILDKGKYSLYMYAKAPSLRRVGGLSIMFVQGIGPVKISEVGCYPIGTILCIDKPENYEMVGLSISSFADCGYNEKCDVEVIGIPYLSINSLLPNDFRTKEQLTSIINLRNSPDTK